jgi:pSer/pThr/pTyr-binding forkhead associated (FHA) protein
MAKLRVASGPLAGQSVEVEDELVIGRDGTDLPIDDAELSGRHAVVRRFANRLQVEDLDSSTGTFVDGTRIAEPTLVGGGAEIKVGSSVLVVEGVLPVQDPTLEEIAQDRNKTRVHGVGSLGAAPGAALRQATPATPAPSSVPLREFQPPGQRPRPGLASRSWVPVALSFGTVILTAIALVIYFSQHS